MQANIAILADFVQENGGKLYITGGGIDTIYAKVLPVRHSSLGLAFRLTLNANELGILHELEIRLVNADGGRLGSIGAKIKADPPETSTGWPVSVPLAINFSQIEFAAFGDYQFQLVVDNIIVTTVPFRVIQG